MNEDVRNYVTCFDFEYPTSDSRIEGALEAAFEFGDVDGGHHKQWLINEMIRQLLGFGGHREWVKSYNIWAAKYGYSYWDEGIAP